MVSASRPDGFGDAEQQVGDRTPRGLTRQPALQHRGHLVHPVGDSDRRAVGEHDHEARVRRGQPGEQVALGRGQVDVRAVEALRLVARRQPEERDHDIGVGRHSHGLIGKLGRRRLVRLDGEARREDDLDPVRHAGAQLVEGDVDPGRVDLRAAGALVARRARELADHREPLARAAGPAAAARRRSSAAPRTAAPRRASAWCASDVDLHRLQLLP